MGTQIYRLHYTANILRPLSSCTRITIEFYELEILNKIGSKLGQLLKVDTCTSSTTRGRYSRICIEVPLEKPPKTHIYIGNHKQILLYEGLNLLCIKCGRFGHASWNCVYAPKANNNLDLPTSPTTTAFSQSHQNKPPEETKWKVVTFPKNADTALPTTSQSPRSSRL